MSLRARLLVTFGSIAVLTVAVVAYFIYAGARQAFNAWTDRALQLVSGQFRREFSLQSDALRAHAASIANSEPVRAMAVTLSSPGGDPAPYVNLATTLAGEQQLDFLEILTDDGTIVSSAQWPARFGLKEAWITGASDWNQRPVFLQYQETPQGNELALVTVQEIEPGQPAPSAHKFYLVAGRRVDSGFLRTLVLPEGTRLLLWREVEDNDKGYLEDTSGPVNPSPGLERVIQETRTSAAETRARVRLGSTSDDVYIVNTIPLLGRNSRLPVAVLVVATSRRELNDLQNRIWKVGLIAAFAGILVSVVVSRWWAARISRPIEELSAAAQDVAAGNWERKVTVSDRNAENSEARNGDSKDEVARLIASFNQMTSELIHQRDRAVQAERVAAWRELARRLAHELKNPLFPLQITVENLMKARQQGSTDFEEIFKESTATLLAEVNNLKKIIGRFSDFSKMPAPQLQSVDLNALLRETVKLFAPQLASANPPIRLLTEFTSEVTTISGDPDLLRRAFENLVLNAIDAMPQGGRLRVSTSASADQVAVEISDTGAGITEEEGSRLFTPYYTTKQHGTGLGLAIVQSVISDHNARISVSSRPGEGTTFRMEFRRTGKTWPEVHALQTDDKSAPAADRATGRV